MTFGEKLQYLRKEQNWTQEQLADRIGISRQSLSKWELGAATPDTEHVVRLSRLFGVSTDTLLLDDAPFPPSAVQAAGSRRRWELIGGGLASSLAATGLLILGICASIFPAVYIEAPMDKEWVRAYSGLSGFLMTNNLCWLFWLLCLTLAGGLAALFRPRLQSLFGRLRHRLAHRQPSQPPAEE